MAGHKRDRTKELLKVKLAEILNKDVADPRLEGLTITLVKMSPDGAQALIFFSLFGRNEEQIREAEKAANDSAGFLQQRLGKSLKTRNTPRLQFRYDKGFDHASRIDDLLHDLSRKPDPTA